MKIRAAVCTGLNEPWKVEERAAPIIHAGLVISRAATIPSRSATRVSNPLSGRTKNWPTLDWAMIALRVLPTPGSTTTRKTVPAG